MRNGFYGAPPHAPTMEKGIYARLRLAIRPCGDCIWGFAPCPNRGGINPTSRSYFGKKNPKDPKKPNCIGFRLSSIDSEQGCRRQPCFMFGAHSAAPQPPRCPTRLPFVPHPPHRPRPLAHPPPTVSPTPPHLLVFTPPAPACLPADALKRQSFSFLQSISNFIVSLQNVSEKT